MPDEHPALKNAREQLATAEARFEEQAELVRRLEANHLSATESRQLLRRLWEGVLVLRDKVAQLESGQQDPGEDAARP
jgi:hypothetical protein